MIKRTNRNDCQVIRVLSNAISEFQITMDTIIWNSLIEVPSDNPYPLYKIYKYNFDVSKNIPLTKFSDFARICGVVDTIYVVIASYNDEYKILYFDKNLCCIEEIEIKDKNFYDNMTTEEKYAFITENEETFVDFIKNKPLPITIQEYLKDIVINTTVISRSNQVTFSKNYYTLDESVRINSFGIELTNNFECSLYSSYMNPWGCRAVLIDRDTISIDDPNELTTNVLSNNKFINFIELDKLSIDL